MILLLDTSTPVCRLGIKSDDGAVQWHEWEAHRELAKGLLAYISSTLTSNNMSIKDISAIGVFKGPGSFTGLRIGLTVANTLADSLHIPIVGVSGEDWAVEALKRLQSGENDQIVIPYYGAEAHITKPRK